MRYLSLILLLFTIQTASVMAQNVEDNTTARDGQRKRNIAEIRKKVRNDVDSVAKIAVEKVENSRTKRTLDFVLDMIGSRSNFDTAYIEKPKERWTFKVRTNFFGSHLRLDTREDAVTSTARLDARPKVTVSFCASYRGLALSASVNPGKWTGKSKDFELDARSYGNSFGFDATYTSADSYHGTWTRGDDEYSIHSGTVKQKLLAVNAYYSFNKRHFSYPAAFSQSQIQKRSCGSWMLGASFANSNLSIDSQEGIGNEPLHQNSTYAAVGGGYAYNLVTPHHWLFHGSFTPELIVYNHSKAETEVSSQTIPYRFPNVIAIAKMGIVHNFRNQFVGCTAVFNNLATGDHDTSHLYNIKWRGRLFWGIRL